MGNMMIQSWQPPSSSLGCRTSFGAIIICSMIQSIFSMTIFTMRLCVDYSASPSVRRFLIASLIAITAIMVACQVYTLHHVIPPMRWSSLIRSCVILNYRTAPLAITYIYPIILESVIFIAMLYHAYGYYQVLADGHKSSRAILQRLYIDGTQYYVMLMLFRLGTVLVFFLTPMGLQLLFNQSEYLISATLTSRYFLSFRRTILDVQSAPIPGISDVQDASTHLSIQRSTMVHARNDVMMRTMSSAWPRDSDRIISLQLHLFYDYSIGIQQRGH